MYPKIRLGLCCINMTLKYSSDTFSSRTKKFDTIVKQGLSVAEEIAKTNVVDLLKMILWAKHHGIDVMRIGSDIIPHGNNPKLIDVFGEQAKEFMTLKFLEPYLQMVGQVAKLENMRLTFHPGQFVQLASPTKETYNNGVRELKTHSQILDMMGLDKNAVIVIHIGGTYSDKKTSVERFIKNFMELDKRIFSRLVLENDEKCYNADDVLAICQRVGRPMVFDYHHYVCYELYHPEDKQSSIDKLMPAILKTWSDHDIRPKFHLSEQMVGKPVGSHSVFIKEIPKVLLDIPSKYGVDIDIMIEAKGKEVAISKLYQKYPSLKPKCSKDLPKTIPKEALKDLNIPDNIKEEICCDCETVEAEINGGYLDEYTKCKSKYFELKYGD